VICKGQKLGKIELFGGEQECLLIKESEASQGPEQQPEEISEEDFNKFAADYRLNIGPHTVKIFGARITRVGVPQPQPIWFFETPKCQPFLETRQQ
jgi:hypothetical protein